MSRGVPSRIWPTRTTCSSSARMRVGDRSSHVSTVTWEHLSPTRNRALEAQVERVGKILDGTPRLTLGPVQVGPHA